MLQYDCGNRESLPRQATNDEACGRRRVSRKWKTMPTRLTPETFEVATDLYFANVVKP
jgi:hypothetical protein